MDLPLEKIFSFLFLIILIVYCAVWIAAASTLVFYPFFALIVGCVTWVLYLVVDASFKTREEVKISDLEKSVQF